MAPSGIEPATFRFVAQYLNQLRYGVPPPLLLLVVVVIVLDNLTVLYDFTNGLPLEAAILPTFHLDVSQI